MEIDRYSTIPEDAIKMTPETDNFPPQLHSAEYEQPVPLAVINTAGAEDSPFIPADRDEIYFFFTPDVRVPVEKQILDGVTGIYVSRYINGSFQEPERVMLQKPGKLALDGCEFVQGNTMLFCSAREGYTGLHWFSAEFKDGSWVNWENADYDPAYEVGELHIHGEELYYHSPKEGGKGGTDIWMLTKADGEWKDPVNVDVLNSEENEGMPYVTADGNELWFNRWYMGTPAVFKSEKVNGQWQEPELIISKFAGEPTLDKDGNVYFVHHFYEDGKMIEADIYVAYRKQ
ncbi:hypothetical protein [Methanococcoides sp. FTZ1]|uniref:hypothetical protein n=1 Tax=Methanococcoides sp. FTZ1 TaxID=3439061 RepID=UPI003F861918